MVLRAQHEARRKRLKEERSGLDGIMHYANRASPKAGSPYHKAAGQPNVVESSGQSTCSQARRCVAIVRKMNQKAKQGDPLVGENPAHVDWNAF